MTPSASTTQSLPWTGERMIPQQSDLATETYHWQRYLFFRPWYVSAKVIDAASGEGYGTNYISFFASKALGYDLSSEAIDHSQKRYPHATFEQGDVCEIDYSEADLVVSFETIEHLHDPIKFLKNLSQCKGRIVISTPNRYVDSPGNTVEDKPNNPYHTIEWSPPEFAALIEAHFPGRQVRFLSQQLCLPGLIKEGLDDQAHYIIAVIGNGDLPKWPSIGVAIPSLNNWSQLLTAIQTIRNSYPGETRFAITANACTPSTKKAIQHQIEVDPSVADFLVQEENLGYGVGCNLALEHLRGQVGLDYYLVANDDIVPAVDCVSQMVCIMQELDNLGRSPGVVGPVSNAVAGSQSVDIGAYSDLPSMQLRAESYRRSHVNEANEAIQVRGLFLLLHPNCLTKVGGFDPIFGIGNFEDDDHNLRCRLAGFSLWIATGAFLHHHGSTTFRKLNVDYASSIEQNMRIMMAKWHLSRLEDWPTLKSTPDGVSLFIPLAGCSNRIEVNFDGRKVDLITEATDIEFAGWVLNRIQMKGAEARKAVVDAIERKIA